MNKDAIKLTSGSGMTGQMLGTVDMSVGTLNRIHHDNIHTPDADLLMEKLIADTCGGEWCGNRNKLGKGDVVYSVEYLADNLPAVQFVAQFYLELIVHGGILAKNPSYQKKLDKWLRQENLLGQTNANVIREGLLSSIIYGYSGLRKVGDNLLYIAPSRFKIWKIPAMMEAGETRGGKKIYRPVPGVTAPVFYEVFRKKREKVNDENKSEEFYGDKPILTIAELIKDQELIRGVDGSYFHDDDNDGATADDVLVPMKNFCHLRHSDDGDYGVSPLSKDRLRTTLIIDYISNVIDEVSNDGTDYNMYLAKRSNVGASLAAMISASAADATINASVDAKAKKQAGDASMNAARDLAKKMKRSNKTRINIINQNHVEKMEKLDGTVHLNEYLSILNNAKATIADIYGIPAMLAGTDGGGWSTGMSALIPFTLERTIKPFQQRYADQLSKMIDRCAGIGGGVEFKELNWEDEKTRAEIDKIKAETEKLLAEANSKKVTDEKTKKETRLMTSKSVNNTENQSTKKSSAKK